MCITETVEKVKAKSSMDPKVKNLLKFLVETVLLPVVLLVALFKYFQVNDFFKAFGIITLAILVWRIGLAVYRRLILPGKKPQEFGKWAIVTGK